MADTTTQKKGAGVVGTVNVKALPPASGSALGGNSAAALTQTIGAGVQGVANIPTPTGNQATTNEPKKDNRTWLEKMIGVDLPSVVFFLAGFGLVITGLVVLFAIGAKTVADEHPEVLAAASRAAAAAMV